MVDEDLTGLADIQNEDSDELTSYLESFIQRAEEILSDADFEDHPYQVLVGTQDSGFMFKLADRKPVETFLKRSPEIYRSDEAEEFAEHLQSNSDVISSDDPLNLERFIFSHILLDAFGPHGERIDSWRSRLPEIENQLQADIVGRPKVRRKCILAGLKVDSDIKLSDSCWLRSPKPGEIVFRNRVSMSTLTGMQTLRADFTTAMLEIEAVESGEVTNGVVSNETDFYTTLFRLYGRSNTHYTMAFDEPISYSAGGGRTTNRDNRPPSPHYKFNPIDVSRFSRLCALLRNYHQEYEFSHPVGVAIEHFEDSLRRRSEFQDSISFSIIGIESIYKQLSEGATSDNDVARFCGLVLSQVSDELNGLEVKNTIDEAYEVRNTWAHGGNADSQASKQLQESLWDFLRGSIVVFAWLDQHSKLPTDGIDLESALVDEVARENLQSSLTKLEIVDYLPMR